MSFLFIYLFTDEITYKCGRVEDEENLALQIQSFDWLKTLCLNVKYLCGICEDKDRPC